MAKLLFVYRPIPEGWFHKSYNCKTGHHQPLEKIYQTLELKVLVIWKKLTTQTQRSTQTIKNLDPKVPCKSGDQPTLVETSVGQVYDLPCGFRV